MTALEGGSMQALEHLLPAAAGCDRFCKSMGC